MVPYIEQPDYKNHAEAPSALTDGLCCDCGKEFTPWYNGCELETEICKLCDMEYQEGAEFTRDNFGDS